MELLTEKEVKHVANLAKLNISDLEIDKYKKQLTDIMTEIDKITNLDITEEEVLIAPIDHINIFSSDISGDMLTKEEIFKNAKNTSGDYLVVPKVLND
jgi:aspartyl-tRNA(Asn)/glutamyl-tRNA(Gln) amidotransferase subunit C